MQKIRPFLWFDSDLEAAAQFYVSVFGDDAEILSTQRLGAGGPVFSMTFRLRNQEFMGLNAGPLYHFTEAVSFFISCGDQAEVDYFWARLLEGGGSESRCGWLKDRFGLSWQVIPEALGRYLGDPDREKANRAMQAMMTMQKIDVATLQKAHAGGL